MDKNWQTDLRAWSEQTARRLTTAGRRPSIIRRMAASMASLTWVAVALAVLWMAGGMEARNQLAEALRDFHPGTALAPDAPQQGGLR